MVASDDLLAIIERITSHKHSDDDLAVLRQAIDANSSQEKIQIGKYIVNIPEGKDVHIGDKFYQGADAEAIKEALRLVVQEKQKAKRPRTEKLLLQAVKEEVAARLKQSLHNAVLINLGKEAQPEQVKRPCSSDIKIGDKPSESIPKETSILEVFDQEEIAGKLLILGNPGAGKSTTMLDLTQALIVRAELNADYPIPVLFNLSNWNDDKQSIGDWLVVELKSKYGVRQDIGNKWVSDAKFLPMLDGLDELGSARQESCVHKINEFLQSDYRSQYLVVCSRQEEYGNYKTRLQLKGAICLLELNDIQIHDYLKVVKQEDLQKALREDSIISELMRKPLLLSIAVLSLKELSIEDWQKLSSKDEKVKYLLNMYVQRMLTREIENLWYVSGREPDKEVTRYRLSWLAQNLEEQKITEFLIEKMQPDCLQMKSQKLYFFAIWQFLAAGLKLLSKLIEIVVLRCEEILNLQQNAISEQTSLIINIPLIISMIPFAISLPVFYFRKIRPVERLKSPFKLLGKEIKIGFIYYSIIGMIVFFLPIKHDEKLKFWAVLLGYYIFFLNRQMIFNSNKIIGSELEIIKFPNQGIRKSAINSITTGLFGTITGIIIIVIWVILINDITIITTLGIRSVYLGFIYAFTFGGYACIQHFFLRLFLLQENAILWNYARFLNYCTERLLLQRVGGRYRFMHRQLQEYFALENKR